MAKSLPIASGINNRKAVKVPPAPTTTPSGSVDEKESTFKMACFNNTHRKGFMARSFARNNNEQVHRRERGSSISDLSDVSTDSGSSCPPSPSQAAVVEQSFFVAHCPLKGCDRTEPLLSQEDLLEHICNVHHVTIRNVHLVNQYLIRYVESIAPKIDSNESITFGSQDDEQDKELRETLQKEKLNEILSMQEYERQNDSTLPCKCLFCSVECPNRAVLFRHMFVEHGFNIGLPDNLVMVNEFLGILEHKLEKNQCLFCERYFKSNPVLRKHMRKKKHFKISPKNPIYDKFYVINYVEPGKNWEHFQNELDEENEQENWDDWNETLPEETMCLFDECVFPCPLDAIEHMKANHDFDLKDVSKNLDFYGVVQIINYIRHQTMNHQCMFCHEVFDTLPALTNHLHEMKHSKLNHEKKEWQQSKYLVPIYSEDPLLNSIDDILSDGE